MVDVQGPGALTAEELAYGAAVIVALEGLEAKITPQRALQELVHRPPWPDCIQNVRTSNRHNPLLKAFFTTFRT